MDEISLLSPCFSPYLTITGLVPGKTYSYKARGLSNRPCVALTWHQEKKVGGKGQSWLYVAVKHGANLAHLASGERLYVGSQTLDRMFRGDVARGTHNFHHREMRSGCGDDNLESFLAAGGQADILIASADALREIFEHNPALVEIMPALTALTARGKHLAHWIEQHVLMVEAGQWRWNKAGPESMAIRFFCGES